MRNYKRPIGKGIYTVEDAKRCLSVVAEYLETKDESPMCATDLRIIRDYFLVEKHKEEKYEEI